MMADCARSCPADHGTTAELITDLLWDEDLTRPEIVERLGVPAGTVWALLRRMELGGSVRIVGALSSAGRSDFVWGFSADLWEAVYPSGGSS
jgi:hypothetical protein